MMITAFEKETRSVSSCAPSSRWRNFECTLQIRPRQLKKPVMHRSRYKLFQLNDAGRLARGQSSEMAWCSKGIETETSCRCHSCLNARWILGSSLSEALHGNELMKAWSGSITKTAKDLFRQFFFSILRLFWTKKRTHKQLRQRNVVVLICQSVIWTVSWHWSDVLAPRSFRITSPSSTPYTFWRKVVRAR